MRSMGGLGRSTRVRTTLKLPADYSAQTALAPCHTALAIADDLATLEPGYEHNTVMALRYSRTRIIFIGGRILPRCRDAVEHQRPEH
jgi:hypothetical protein